MKLWLYWFNVISLLRPAFARYQTFLWFCVCVMGLTVRNDKLGVTSVVRALGLDSRYYYNLLDNFHSTGIKLDQHRPAIQDHMDTNGHAYLSRADSGQWPPGAGRRWY